jgi:uncharacterized protein involved in response to NO
MQIFELGFRPFYALASIFAIVAVIAWLGAFAGILSTGEYLPNVVWHSHEMLFGFSVAVITGFLLTAVRNWTGLPTPSGAVLAGVAVLWITARVLLISGPAVLAAAVDVLFLPVVVLAIAKPIFLSKSARNYKVVAVVMALAVSHTMFHLARLDYVAPWWSRTSLLVSIDIVLVLMAIVAGRVIPAFTKNAVPDATPRTEFSVELLAFAAMVLVVFATAMSGVWAPPSFLMTLLFVVIAAAHAIRLALWDPGKTIYNPLLWMMPVAYSWIPFAFILRALTASGVVSGSAWIHAVTMGAFSSFMLAMMMRSSLGHTGRQLVASRLDISAFVLLQIAALVRVLASIAAGATYRHGIIASGVIWVLAFSLFALRYLPMLSQPRAQEES